MSKQEVKYDLTKYNFVKLGAPAVVKPINHPSKLVSNERFSMTTTVISMAGVDFETMNTRYVGVFPENESEEPLHEQHISTNRSNQP